MAGQLRDRIALVTGAGRGIGQGIATVLAFRGATVVLADIDEASAVAAAEEIAGAGGTAMAVRGDVTDQQSMNEAAAETVSRFGRIDVCVANAGVIGAPGFEERQDYVEEDWDATYAVNVKGLVHTADAVVPHMKERKSGRIVNIASHGGRAPRLGVRSLGGGIAPYSVSKAAAIQWTWTLALRLGEYKITVNVVCPGTLWTPMWEKIALVQKAADPALKDLSPREIFLQSVRERTPLGREQTPEHIGRAVAFFASDDARVITGQALNVNGGAVMN